MKLERSECAINDRSCLPSRIQCRQKPGFSVGTRKSTMSFANSAEIIQNTEAQSNVQLWLHLESFVVVHPPVAALCSLLHLSEAPEKSQK